jgi:hypothetical protein
MRRQSKLFATAACLLSATLSMSGTARADVLVDRGLPTANLNAPDSSRSNVSWTDSGQTPASPTPGDYYVEGDTFTNTSTATWLVNTIRLWTVGPFDSGSLTLLGGSTSAAASTFTTISSLYSSTPTTYAGGASYTTSSGGSLSLTEIDFSVNLTLAAGEQFVYFLNGTGGRYVVPFMSASNAALSGSPQDQADGLIWEAEVVGGTVASFDSFSAAPYWDKASDFNVQVLGSAVPEPGSVALVGIGLMGALCARRRRS